MRLVKIQSDKILIKSDDEEFRDIRVGDLISISDGQIELVTMVSVLQCSDVDAPIEDDMALDRLEIEQVKTIECSVMGAVVDGKFTNAVDKYPTTTVEAKIVSNERFAEIMQSKVKGFTLGNYAGYDCPAVIDGNKFFQRHSCIVGNTGSGKSETVTKVLEETAKNTNCNIIVFDIHGEYKKLSYVDNITIGEDFSFPIWLFGFSDMVSNLLKVKEESATVAMSVLRKAYASVCSNPNEDKPICYDFNRLFLQMKALDMQQINTGEVYKSGDRKGQSKTVKGDFNGKLTSLCNSMESILANKRYSFLFDEQPQSYLNELMDKILGGGKVKNIDLSEIPHDVAIMVIGAIAKLVYNVQLLQDNPKSVTMVCDEAHVYIPTDFQLSASQRRMVEIFEIIAKEGRKFGVTLFVASQRPSELNRTIMAQCANYIVMKLNNENDKTMMKGIMPDRSSGVIEQTSRFAPGDAMVIGDALQIPLKLHVDLAEERPQAKTIDYWTEWQKAREDVAIGEYLEEYLRG